MIPCNVYPASSVVPIFFATYSSDDPTASMTLTGLAVTDIEIYKGTSMTQRASDAGYTLLDTDGIDIDTITGIHGFSIDLGDNTDAGFYAVGSFYTVVVSAITVDGATINFIADRFRIVAAESVAGKPKVDVDAWLGTAAATPTVAGVPEVDVTHVGGTAQTAGDLKASLNTIDDFVDTEIADIQARLPAALTADGNMKADTLRVGGTLQTAGDIPALVTAVDNFVDTEITDIQARLPAALTVDGNIKADTLRVGGTLQTAGDIPALVTAVDDLVDTELAAVKTDTGNLVTRVGTPSDLGGGATVAANLSDIEAQTDDIGAAGAGLTALATQASVNTIDDFLDTEIAAIIATLGAAGAGLTAIPWNAAWDAEVQSEVNDAIDTAIAELGVAAPTATPTIRTALMLMYMALRNKLVVQTSGTDAIEIYNDAGTKIAAKAITDDGADYTEAEMA